MECCIKSATGCIWSGLEGTGGVNDCMGTGSGGGRGGGDNKNGGEECMSTGGVNAGAGCQQGPGPVRVEGDKTYSTSI